MASRAYQRFTRDMSLGQINQLFARQAVGSPNELSDGIKECLPLITELTGAHQASILINLPFGRPITHSYNAIGQKTVTHDDGRIPGAVTIRSFVYGDECWYERYRDFAERLQIPTAKHLESADYVCIAPIRVHKNNIGVLMLTRFDDERIRILIKSGAIEDERAAGRALMDVLSSAFSAVMIQNMQSHSTQSSELLTLVRDQIPVATGTEEFVERFCGVIRGVTGLRVMLHQKVESRGQALCQAGLSPAQWAYFTESPFNLQDNAPKAYGSTVVAFREGKSSYLKDWQEIREKLHPKTVEILDEIGVKSFCAVPLRSGADSFVVTLMSSKDEPPKDPGIMTIIESTEAIFDAALTVLGQRSSVLALGKLASRLIGDDDVRSQIIEAAKSETLPTTIGTARTSFLLLFDLAGSSLLPADTEEKARSYGVFYDEVNKAVHKHLGGQIRKTIGDAIIATWDGTGVSLADHPQILDGLLAVVQRANQVAVSVGCSGVRAVLHHGDYFFGLIGTSSFGQIDVIGRGIDEVCKMEGAMKVIKIQDHKIKIAISAAASVRLPSLKGEDFVRHDYHYVSPLDQAAVSEHAAIVWAKLGLMPAAAMNDVADREPVTEPLAS